MDDQRTAAAIPVRRQRVAAVQTAVRGEEWAGTDIAAGTDKALII